ncbi:hypothetical protein P4V47_03925 [Brevibacillus laterosporus]|uniref:hypothetical protein n=1 Tax=Brevibacillus laterosporus TaxID=1465 RepID=UPI002E1B47F5|nr:hypothetical protein [Brevibacillus laterosporus]
MQIRYSGKYLVERKPIKTDHKILVFHRLEHGDSTNNKPYDDILEHIPNAYCDGWTIYLPLDFDRQIIDRLIEFFQQDRYFLPDNIARIIYVNEELKN